MIHSQCCRIQSLRSPVLATGRAGIPPPATPHPPAGAIPEDRISPEFPHVTAGRGGDDGAAGVEVGAEGGHRRVEDQPAVGGQPPEDRPVRDGADRVAAAPQRATHGAVPGGNGSGVPTWAAGPPLEDGSGPRQRGQRRQGPNRIAGRSGVMGAPQRRQRTGQLIGCPPQARWRAVAR